VLVLLLQARGPHNWAKIAVFDQYLVVGSTTAGASSVVNSFERGVKFITADDDHHASHNLVYDMQQRFDVVYISRRVSRREQNRIIIIVRIGKSKAVVTITDRLHSRIVLLKLTTDKYEASYNARPLCDSRASCYFGGATVKLLFWVRVRVRT